MARNGPELRLTLEDGVLNFIAIRKALGEDFTIGDLASYLGVGRGRATNLLSQYGLHLVDRVGSSKATTYVVNPNVTTSDFTHPPVNIEAEDGFKHPYHEGFGSGVAASALNPIRSTYNGVQLFPRRPRP